jgi:hypothetical protein
MAYDETKVEVATTQAEIRKLFTKHRIRVHAISEDHRTDPPTGIVQFVTDDLQVRFVLQYKDKRKEAASIRTYRHKRTVDEIAADLMDQEARRIWRVLFWTLRAKLIAIEEGLRTAEQEFLSDTVDPRDGDGRTVYQILNEDRQLKERIRVNGTGLALPTGNGPIMLPAGKVTR